MLGFITLLEADEDYTIFDNNISNRMTLAVNYLYINIAIRYAFSLHIRIRL